MRVRSRWQTVAISLAVATALAASGEADGQPIRPARDSLSLSNGVGVARQCDRGKAATGVPRIAFGTHASHKFLGYGVAIETGKAAQNISRTIDILKKLGFAWVKLAFARGDKSDEEKSNDIQPASGSAEPYRVDVDIPPANKRLFDALRASGIKIVDVIHRPPAVYFDTTEVKKGRHGRKVKPDTLPSLAQYYVTYLRAMFSQGIKPDLIELINEPNLRQGGRYKPEEYASLLKAVETGLGTAADPNLSAPATATNVPVGLEFVQALERHAALAPMKAITLHTYYVRDRPNNGGIPPADDPALKSLFATAQRLGVPLMSTEFGGTDIKTKLTDPGRNSVDPAEEFKAALDLIRSGESAAIVWNLYPNTKNGALLNTWALVDARGPTNAYWLFDILSRRVPIGSDVLDVEKTNATAAMTSPGYAAFRDGNNLYVGLSNPQPSQTPTTLELDMSSLGPVTITHVASFLSDKSIGQDSHIRVGECSVSVTLPSGTGTMLDIAQSQ